MPQHMAFMRPLMPPSSAKTYCPNTQWCMQLARASSSMWLPWRTTLNGHFLSHPAQPVALHPRCLSKIPQQWLWLTSASIARCRQHSRSLRVLWMWKREGCGVWTGIPTYAGWELSRQRSGLTQLPRAQRHTLRSPKQLKSMLLGRCIIQVLLLYVSLAVWK